MKALVCGAGVQGSFLACYLQKNGADVSLLARGERFDNYRQNGIRIAYHPSDLVATQHVPIVSRIDAEEAYDLFLVSMQKQQAIEFAPFLGERIECGIAAFLGNNVTATNDYKAFIPPDRILLGFLGVAGRWESDYIRMMASDSPVIWVGNAGIESSTALRSTVDFLSQMNFSPEVPRSIDGWLKCHIAFILPLVGAIYAANGDNHRLARTPALMRLMLQGVKDAFRIIRKLGIKIEPSRFNTLSRMPIWLLQRLFSGRMGSRESEISLAGHAGAARAEMKHLANEFQELADESGAKTPAFDRLMEYLHSDTLLVDDGTTIPLL
ncbi:MAG: hypothetical protein EAX95_14595 [Candidatus Thorarchaeota archaeon]|nr:hypothetical protein [Candidatus Thorarchaeota archaeon]